MVGEPGSGGNSAIASGLVGGRLGSSGDEGVDDGSDASLVVVGVGGGAAVTGGGPAGGETGVGGAVGAGTGGGVCSSEVGRSVGDRGEVAADDSGVTSGLSPSGGSTVTSIAGFWRATDGSNGSGGELSGVGNPKISPCKASDAVVNPITIQDGDERHRLEGV